MKRHDFESIQERAIYLTVSPEKLMTKNGPKIDTSSIKNNFYTTPGVISGGDANLTNKPFNSRYRPYTRIWTILPEMSLLYL